MLSAANTFEPMWQCSPTSSIADDRCARSTARAASPLARLKPNFESSWPVAMYSWVWAWTPGVTRISTFGARVVPPPAATPAGRARRSCRRRCCAPRPRGPARSSSTLLLLPCIVHEPAGTPAASATCSSPPLATSSSRPSSYGEAGHRLAQERLGGVHDALRAERGDRLPAAGAEVLLVVDEQRRAVARRPARRSRTRRWPASRRAGPRHCPAAARSAANSCHGRGDPLTAHDCDGKTRKLVRISAWRRGIMTSPRPADDPEGGAPMIHTTLDQCPDLGAPSRRVTATGTGA